MAAQDRLDKWLPEAVGVDAFDLEKQVLSRVADVWVYQRSIFDEPPYGLLDELAYAKENGYLEDFILTARPNEFVEARKAWSEGDPARADAFRDWFLRVFEREPPGLRGSSPPPARPLGKAARAHAPAPSREPVSLRTTTGKAT